MNKIWIIGAGGIAQEYAKVLQSLDEEYIVIGRSKGSATKFEENIGVKVYVGGLTNFLETKPLLPKAVIVAVGIMELKDVAILLMGYGVRQILLEKPGGYCPQELYEINSIAKATKSQIFLAYNRRFYSSVLKAEEIIKEDGGLNSFNFEFTEWEHIIDKSKYDDLVLSNWFFGNSTHVIDLAFFLGGKPQTISCYTKGSLSWHSPSIFVGSGITENGCLFSYGANWGAPGRWSVELLTSKHRLYLRPMEILQIQNVGSVQISQVEINDDLDKKFKPGFYLETKAFIEHKNERLCSIDEQIHHIKYIYNKILNK